MPNISTDQYYLSITVHGRRVVGPYYTTLYSTLLNYTILYYTTLYSTLLHSTLLYYTKLYYTTLYYTLLYSTLLYSTKLWSPGRRTAPGPSAYIYNDYNTLQPSAHTYIYIYI